MDTTTLIFLHIPKTGGRSLQNIILRKYSEAEAITDAHGKLADIASWSDERKRKIKYLQGHFIYGAHEKLPQDTRYITMLRDPVDRVISHYYYIRRSATHPLNRVLEENNIDLKEYITSEVSDEIRNDQTRMIAGAARGSSIEVDDMICMAKENINSNFLLAGCLEQFDESLVLLKRRLGLRNIFYGVRNQTMNRPLKEQIPEATLELIRECNNADIQLYAHAREKLAGMLDAEGESFGLDVAKFKRRNHIYSSLFHLGKVVKHKMSAFRIKSQA